MKGFSKEKSLISIRETTKRHERTCSMLIALHALTGCDSVPMMFGIGKATAIDALQSVPLIRLGRADSTNEEVITEGKTFVAACYRCKDVSSSANRLPLLIFIGLF